MLPETRIGHGFYRIAAVSPDVFVANPRANVDSMIREIDAADSPDLLVFPELGLTGYTCGDLLLTTPLLLAAQRELSRLADHSVTHDAIIVAGLPLAVGARVLNVAAVIAGGEIAGIVPKTFLPNYREFYEQRHFAAASPADPETVLIGSRRVPLGTNLLFVDGPAILGVEICEDLWVPIPPSCHAALAGANVIANLSASNELIGKAHWRRELVRSQSGRLIAAYAYASAGAGESSSDLVFGGHNLIAENGSILGQSRRIGDGQPTLAIGTTSVTCDVDLQRLAHDRRVTGSFDHHRAMTPGGPFRRIEIRRGPSPAGVSRLPLHRTVDAHPFVPDDPAQREMRCAEILDIQTAGLVKRLSRLPDATPLTIGISGGLDSTLALIVALQAVDHLSHPRQRIHAFVMPGFGTSAHTRRSATDLVEATGVTTSTVDIRRLCLQTFAALEHRPLGLDVSEIPAGIGQDDLDALQDRFESIDGPAQDLVFENVQARVRTMLLMNGGFVLGTGDLSEQALGWSTYNADHMSMYNVNASIPKTLVRYLVRYAADHLFDQRLNALLHRIADTPISPELMPLGKDGVIRQHSESSLGPYELHDFFLYHFVRGGGTFEKLAFLAGQTKFDQPHNAATIDATLRTFLRRFFQNQFKRNCVPDGPKVGSVSLSPRGDWRMPADADVDAFLPPKSNPESTP